MNATVNEWLYPPGLANHNGYKKLFSPSKLSFGLIAPMQGYSTPFPNLQNHEELVMKADDVGIDAIWLRDVPFYDPNFGDVGQGFDVISYAGWLAAKTKNIIIGTSGVVLPFRDPILLAKQVISLDHLSKGRFILGIASGDRPSEYPAFGVDYTTRADRFAEATLLLKAVIGESFPKFKSDFYGELKGNLDMFPKPYNDGIPIINIGRAGQSMDWISDNTDGWIWHGMKAQEASALIESWRNKNGNIFKPYGYGNFFELSENPDAPLQLHSNLMSGGRNALIKHWEKQRSIGISHIILNLKPSSRNPFDVLEEFGKHIVPAFK